MFPLQRHAQFYAIFVIKEVQVPTISRDDFVLARGLVALPIHVMNSIAEDVGSMAISKCFQLDSNDAWSLLLSCQAVNRNMKYVRTKGRRFQVNRETLFLNVCFSIPILLVIQMTTIYLDHQEVVDNFSDSIFELQMEILYVYVGELFFV